MLSVMLAAVIISLGYVLQYTSTSLSTQIAATNFQYVGIMALPVTWVVFSLQYTGHGNWLTRRSLLLLSIVPFVTVVLVWTNGIDGLMYHGRHLDTSGPFTIISKTYGPWFWIAMTNNYLLMSYGMFLLIQRLFRPPSLYHRQSIALLICVIVPLAWNVMYIFDLTALYHVDLTPSALVISGLAIAWGLFRVRLFDIIPLARDIVVEGMSDGVIVLDTENRLVDLNRAAERIVGLTPSEVIGQPVANVLSGQPKLVELFGMASAPEERLEVKVEKGETQRYYDLHTSPLHDRRGQLTGRVIILTDITERKKIQEQLIVSDRLSSIGEFASGVAHEINNPLTSIVGFSDVLLEEDVPDDVNKYLRVINREARRASMIVKNLLTFVRKHESVKQPTNMNDAIKTVLQLRAYEQEENNIQVDTRFDPDLPESIADGYQLQQVFMNIITNAEHSMIKAHGKGTLTITTERAGDTIRASFTDDGTGISQENLGHLFEPFFTTKEVGEGTGLGLSISYGIIAEHGGRIWAESELAKGATFVVELPISMTCPQ